MGEISNFAELHFLGSVIHISLPMIRCEIFFYEMTHSPTLQHHVYLTSFIPTISSTFLRKFCSVLDFLQRGDGAADQLCTT